MIKHIVPALAVAAIVVYAAGGKDRGTAVEKAVNRL
jgi:hypothetical protein